MARGFSTTALLTAQIIIHQKNILSIALSCYFIWTLLAKLKAMSALIKAKRRLMLL